MASTRGLGPTQSWQVIGPRRLTLRIREEILREIDERRLVPGDRLPSERDLAELLQVSRPSVREAVTALEVEGRLKVIHGRGVFVAEPETSRRLRVSLARHHHDLSELFMMREALEVPATTWAAEKQDARALREVQEAFDALELAWQGDQPGGQLADPDDDELGRLDAAFHLAIVRASGNRFMEQVQGLLSEMMRTSMSTTLPVPGRARRSRIEHARILAAVLAGDAAAAGRAARAHIRHAHRAAVTQTEAE